MPQSFSSMVLTSVLDSRYARHPLSAIHLMLLLFALFPPLWWEEKILWSSKLASVVFFAIPLNFNPFIPSRGWMSKSWLRPYFSTDFLSFALQLLHRWSRPALCNVGVLSTYCLLSPILDWGRNSPILTSCCRKGAFQSPGGWPLADILGFPKQSTFTKLLAAENLSEVQFVHN